MGRRTRGMIVACLGAALSFPGQTPAMAKNFGSYGPVFPVTEPDFLEEILSRFRMMEENGGLAQMERDMQARTRDYLERPQSAAILAPAEEYRAFQFDPSIVLDRDLADHQGTVFARAGTRVNPLEHSGFSKRIVVIDGDVEDQVGFALAEGNELDTLIVIAKGAPLDLMRRHGRRFWFDQDGVIVNRFGLEHLPSVITRADPVLLIEEIPTGEDGQ
ncbi:hypothetical protein [Paenirhodobacter populi]|uniref:Type-F conjugative transfer system protein TraW N-terminal domain-containing protein n=1 Tax=Paenirhodobacter populi TaxID=2306993 RepID=A0A443JR24_9RHOB|nr:hypothetical protein [Sinirhodobacter populi]RWR22953.1 hypothetical protein D2T30_04820 [Sinirhodobacter populi]